MYYIISFRTKKLQLIKIMKLITFCHNLCYWQNIVICINSFTPQYLRRCLSLSSFHELSLRLSDLHKIHTAINGRPGSRSVSSLLAQLHFYLVLSVYIIYYTHYACVYNILRSWIRISVTRRRSSRIWFI